MSNKRLDLWRISAFNIINEHTPIENYSNYEALAWCDFDNMYHLPKFVTRCIAGGIKPLCGVAFKLKTPETCLTDALCVVCYAEDYEGCEELQFLYSRSDDGEINYEDFCKFSNHLQVGLDLILDEIEMLAIENILETVFVPDFVLIDLNQNSFRSWKRCQKFLEDNNVLICGSSFPMSRSLSDEEVLEDFDFLGDKAYEYVIENPWKIADRISGNYKFDVSLIEEIEDKREEWRCTF